jgi:PAS domain S-box-containing protein
MMQGGAGELDREAMCRQVFDHVAVGLCVTGVDGRIFPNQAFADMVGYQREELIGTSWKDVTHADDVQMCVDAIAKLVAGEATCARLVKRYVHRTGRVVWGDVSVWLERDSTGRPAVMITSISDITQRRQLEEDLRQRSAILAAEHEAVPEGILAVDAQGHVLSCNRRFLEVCSIPPAAADTRDDGCLLAEAVKQVVEPEAFLEKVKELYRTPTASSRDKIGLKNGRTVERVSVPMVSAEGQILGRLWCFRDVTMAKRAEADLRGRLTELERWQDLILGREDRIGELKREVNGLLRRLGEAERYASQEGDAIEVGHDICNVTTEMLRVPDPEDTGGKAG